MKYTSKRKPNPVARELRGPRFRKRVVSDKHKQQKEKDEWKEMMNYMKSLS